MFLGPASRSPISVPILLLAGVIALESVTAAQPADLFSSAATFDSGGINLSDVAVADLNGDGFVDVVTANASGGVGLSLGTGDGTFMAPVIISQPGSGAVAIADVNGDGTLDVIVTIWGQSAVGVLVNNGDGTFQPATTYFAGLNYAVAVAVADVNGDAHADVLVGDCGANGCSPEKQAPSACYSGMAMAPSDP